MVGYETVVANIERPKWRDKDIIDVQDTQDIINDLIYCFKRYNEQARPVAKKFSTGFITSDARNIYDFIKNNIQYVAEPEKYQTTRSFSRIIHDKFGDCKHSALLASSIAWNLGYNIIFRFVGYDRGATYGHVYTIIENAKTGRQVVIDPLQPFNTEKHYYKKIDYKANNNLNFNPMLSRLTGVQPTMVPQNSKIKYNGVGYTEPTETHMVIGNTEIILSPSISGDEADTLDGLCGIGKRSKAERKAARKEAKATRKQVRADTKAAGKGKRGKEKRQAKREARGGSRVKKFHLAPVRHAFTSLLYLNFRGLASRLADSIKVNEGEVKKFAAKLAYNYGTLKNIINVGSKKAPLFGSRVKGIHDAPMSYRDRFSRRNINRSRFNRSGRALGVAPVAAAAPIVIGTPAILLALALFKQLGVGGKGAETDSSAMLEAVQNLEKGGTNISVDAGGDSATPGEGGGQSMLPSGGGGGGGYTDAGGGGGGGGELSTGGGGGAASDTEADQQPGGGGFMESIKNLPTPVKVLGGAALAFGLYKLATMKKGK